MERDEAVRLLTAALNDPAQSSRHDEIRAALRERQAAPPEIVARQKAMTHTPDEGASEDVIGQSHEGEVSAGDSRLRAVNDRAKGMVRGVATLGKTAYREATSLPGSIKSVVTGGPATDYLTTNPAAARQLLRGADDVATLGYGRQLADSIHAAQGRGHPLADVEAADEASNPDERTAGGMVAMAAPNPFGLAAKGTAPIASKLIRGTGPAAGIGRSLLSYEAAAPPLAAAHANSSGNRAGAAGEAATDPLALLVAGMAGGAGGVARRKAERIRDPETESGHLLRDLKTYGGPDARINKFGEPVSGGIFESKEMKGVSKGMRGTGEMAEKSMNRIDVANNNRIREAREQYGDAQDNIILSHGDKPHSAANAHSAIDRLTDELTVKADRPDAVIQDKPAVDALNHVRSMLTQEGGVDEQASIAAFRKKLGIPPSEKLSPRAEKALRAQMPPEDLVAGQTQEVTAQDFVKTRKHVRMMANNAPTASERRVYQVLLGAMDEDADKIDPRIKQMNANFRDAMVPVETTDEIMFGKKNRKHDPELTPAQRRTGAGNLMRIGEDTKPGIIREPQFQDFERQGPEYAREAQLMRAKQIQETLRRGEPEVQASFGKTMARAAKGSAATIAGASAGGSAGGVLGAIIGTGAGLGVDLYRANPLANRIRLALPAAESAGRKLTGSSAAGIDELSRLAAKRGKKKRSQGAENAIER